MLEPKPFSVKGELTLSGSTFKCLFSPYTPHRKMKAKEYDVVETRYHYVLGNIDGEVFTIQYIFHYTEFAQLLRSGVIKVL